MTVRSLALIKSNVGREASGPWLTSHPLPPRDTSGNQAGACGGPQHLTEWPHGKSGKLKLA